jgi:hypothetical protein
VFAAVGDATHFHVASIQPDWAGLIRVGQVGTHIFYKFGGRPAAAVVTKVVHVEPAIDAYAKPQADPAASPVILANAQIIPVPVKAEAQATATKPEALVKGEPAPAKVEMVKGPAL